MKKQAFHIFFSFCAMLCIIGASTFALSLPVNPDHNSNALEKVRIEGLVVKYQGNLLVVRNAGGVETNVQINSGTQISEKKKNFFRPARKYSADQLQRGLFVEVEGYKNDSGAIDAVHIRFRQDDLKMASAVETVVVPVEDRLSSTEQRLSESEKNAERLSGQIQEVSELSDAARNAARTAQDSADQANAAAMESAEIAQTGLKVTNERIASLDDYEIKSSLTVNFAVGSAVLDEVAKTALDQLAMEAGGLKGFLMEVTGYASSDGNSAYNKRLSQRRADTVVDYLVVNHSVPPRRIVRPVGFGENNPVSDNSTRDGRKQNRRVEIKLLVSKGLMK